MDSTRILAAARFSLIAAACLAMLTAVAAEPETADAGQRVVRAGAQPSTFGPAENFTGRVRVDPLFGAEANLAASGAYVTFEPGARSAWHTHLGGQRLVVVAGVGLTQHWGGPVQEVRPGDVVVCPPGVKHWHGATPTTAMTHLTVTGVVGGKTVQWMEKVSDDQYNAR
jgi:4-carboxymuconolactone decarboxylase